MRTTTCFGAVLLAALCIGPVTAQSQSVDEAPAEPGTYELTQGDSGRRYTLVIPEGYSQREAVPLIMSLHFGARSPIELTVVDGITHFQMALYQPHLEAAVPWILEAWRR